MLEPSDPANSRTALKLELLDATCKNLPLVMYTTDLAGNISFSGGKEDVLIGDQKPQELEGQNINAVFKEHPSILAVHESALKGYHGSFEWFQDPSVIQVYVRPYTSPENEIVGTVCVGIDVSESRKFERQLIEAKQQAERALRMKTEFLNVMSHEIRTPLNAIIGISHLLSEDAISEPQKENIDILKYSAENLLSLINDVLDYGKLESGKMELDLRAVHIRHLLQASINAHQVKAKEKGILLKLIYDESLPESILADPTRINQVLNNLLSNAIKFTDKGHVSLRLLHRLMPGNKVAIRFMVEDTGIGIPKDKVDAIFEQFVQADVKINQKFGGSGLGLSISKFIVEMMGGHLAVSSAEGKGSVFHFETQFDRINHLDETIVQQKISTENSLGEVRVLLVDDNNVNRKIAARFLNKWNMEVFEAADGLEAFEMCKKQAFDVILMDLQMPVMDGYESTEKILEWERNHGRFTPILAVTAETLDDVRLKIRKAGMIDVVTKPFKPDNLFKTINAAVRIKE